MLAHNRRRRHHIRSARRIDARNTERRFEAARRHNRHAFETHEVGGTDENGHVETAIAQQAICVGGHGARIDQPGMGRNDGDQVALQIAARSHSPVGLGEVPINGFSQGPRRPRVPAPGDGRPTDIHACTCTVDGSP